MPDTPPDLLDRARTTLVRTIPEAVRDAAAVPPPPTRRTAAMGLRDAFAFAEASRRDADCD